MSMQRVMCVWIPNWPLQRLVLERPQLHGRTVVIYETTPQGGLKVVAATGALGASMQPVAGIYPGMPLAEAAALLAHAREGRAVANSIDEPHLEPADADADLVALNQLADGCHCFSPIVGLEDSPRPDCLLLDVTGLAHLFGDEERFAAEVVRWFTARGLAARVTIADTIGAAWAVVHAGPHPVRLRSPQATLSQGERDLLAPLPIGYLRVSDDTVALLATLGLYRIGQVAALPREALLSRFGPELLRRLDQATGHAREIITARHAPAEYAADFAFEAPIANREAIELMLERLIGQICEPLARRREGVLRLMCRLKYERALVEESSIAVKTLRQDGNGLLAFSLSLFRPSASPRYLCDLLRLRMENLRLPGPVTSIHIEATATGPLGLCQQPLFDAEVETSRPRRLTELIDRLSNRLGRQAVVQVALLADAQPEYTCVDVPLAGNVSRTASRPKTVKRAKTRGRKNLEHVARYGLLSFAADERPIALLPQPAAIEVIAAAPGGLPRQFRKAGRVHAIAQAWGPERIETGWWRTAGGEPGAKRGGVLVRRDYYRVETKSGSRFWIYRNLRTREWFLHGAFD